MVKRGRRAQPSTTTTYSQRRKPGSVRSGWPSRTRGSHRPSLASRGRGLVAHRRAAGARRGAGPACGRTISVPPYTCSAPRTCAGLPSHAWRAGSSHRCVPVHSQSLPRIWEDVETPAELRRRVARMPQADHTLDDPFGLLDLSENLACACGAGRDAKICVCSASSMATTSRNTSQPRPRPRCWRACRTTSWIAWQKRTRPNPCL